jgi:tight adherence protein B
MAVQLVIFVICFAWIFGVIYFLYPLIEQRLRRWQDQRIGKLSPKLDDMFLVIPRKKLVLIDVLTPLGCAGLGYLLSQSLALSLAAALVGLVVPLIVVKQMEAKRRRKFASQIVDGLMVLSSSLKAGLSLLQAFETLIEEMPPPIAQEFTLVVRQLHMGVSLEEALITLRRRMRSDELDLVVTAIMVARETGGNLTEVFSNVANTIQERNKLIGRVNALTVQGKLQGIIMSMLPIAFAMFVFKANPRFFDILLKDPLGRMLLGYAAVSQVLGMVFIRKFSKVDI